MYRFNSRKLHRLLGLLGFMCLFGVLVCFALPGESFAARLTDDRGYMRNGRLEEYDRRLKEAEANGNKDKRGYYIDPEYRFELITGMDPDEYEAMEEAMESLYFYEDGTPKPGTFYTPEEWKRHQEEMERADWWLRYERIPQLLQQEKEEERRRKRESDAEFLHWMLGVMAAIGGFILLCIAAKEETEGLRQKHKPSYSSYNGRVYHWPKAYLTKAKRREYKNKDEDKVSSKPKLWKFNKRMAPDEVKAFYRKSDSD